MIIERSGLRPGQADGDTLRRSNPELDVYQWGGIGAGMSLTLRTDRPPYSDKRVRQAIFNMRQMSLSFVTTQSIKHAIALYNEQHYQRGTTGPYRIDPETLAFVQTDPLEGPLVSQARKFLSKSMAYEPHARTTADALAPIRITHVAATNTRTRGWRYFISSIIAFSSALARRGGCSLS